MMIKGPLAQYGSTGGPVKLTSMNNAFMMLVTFTKLLFINGQSMMETWGSIMT
jgi:hypothetical protein